MPITNQIVLGIFVLSIPLVTLIIYIKLVERNVKYIIKKYTKDSSAYSENLNVWIKGFDVLKKRNYFDLNIYQPFYDFRNCDLIVNQKNFIVIGKSRKFGKIRNVTPIIFEMNDINSNEEYSSVVVKKVSEVENNLEIIFQDNRYPNKMTLVIKNVEEEVKKRILNITN